MKPPLDDRLDDLLASRPLRPSADFSARVLQAVREEEAAARRQRRLVVFALPLVAAFAVAAAWIALTSATNSSPETERFAQAAPELREVILLEDGLADLADLADVEEDGFEVDGLLTTFEALYHETES